MKAGDQNYELFLRFFNTYAPIGFKGIDSHDPLLIELEKMMEVNNQFFYVGDMFKYEILFVSKRTVEMLGVEPKDFTPYSLIKSVHPDDIERHNLGRTKLHKMAYDVYLKDKKYSYLSTILKMRNATGQYVNLLHQVLIFYITIPYNSAFIIKVHTNVDWFQKLKQGFHYYSGNDLSFFRTPDENLLMTSLPYSKREFEIIKMAATGIHSEDIAEKLFLSPETVYTHRRNILMKSSKTTLSGVIYDLMEQGVL